MFLSFLKSFFHFLKSFFIIFASSGAKIFQEMENYNFPRFFPFFYHFFKHVFIIFASSGGIDEKWQKMMKNDEKKEKHDKIKKWKNPRKIAIFTKNEKMQFSSSFFFFFPPFFPFYFFIFFSFLIIFHHF